MSVGCFNPKSSSLASLSARLGSVLNVTPGRARSNSPMMLPGRQCSSAGWISISQGMRESYPKTYYPVHASHRRSGSPTARRAAFAELDVASGASVRLEGEVDAVDQDGDPVAEGTAYVAVVTHVDGATESSPSPASAPLTLADKAVVRTLVRIDAGTGGL